MSMWLYQINQQWWEPRRYRLEIWEDERWAWPVGRKVPARTDPEPGDTVVFFYAQTGGRDAGFYGWAVIVEWLRGEAGDRGEVYFRPVSPSDHLKMHPWWDDEARSLADQIRGKVKQGTFWLVPEDMATSLRRGITGWLTGISAPFVSPTRRRAASGALQRT